MFSNEFFGEEADHAFRVCSAAHATSRGIPIGPDYEKLAPARAQIVDEAVENIRHIAETYRYRRVFYSAANEKGDLGTGIFIQEMM
jgi:hypothetical protein